MDFCLLSAISGEHIRRDKLEEDVRYLHCPLHTLTLQTFIDLVYMPGSHEKGLNPLLFGERKCKSRPSSGHGGLFKNKRRGRHRIRQVMLLSPYSVWLLQVKVEPLGIALCLSGK